MRVRLASHGHLGFRLNLFTTRYLRTLWVRWPNITKLERHAYIQGRDMGGATTMGRRDD